jgi:hypothetical protein
VLRDLGQVPLKGLISKPGSELGEEGRRRVENHVETALELLASVNLPPGVRDVIRHHHERWDGGGYPDGLVGEAIPLGARIVAVADSFAAMISARPHRLPRRVPAAVEDIKAGAGKQYDPSVVNVLQRTTVNPELKVGSIGETVNVTGETAALIETTKTDVGGVIDQRRLESLPVNGRSFASLAVLIPGATLQPSFDPTKARVGTFSVGGSTGRNLNITIDGGDNKDNAVGGILQNFSMEGIQEFALSTQRFSAANGRSGGALLSVVSKGGSNDFHGSVFGFFRDDKLNANAPALLAEAQLEIEAWNDAKTTLRTFIRRFPTSAHINDARAKLAEVSLFH